MAARFIGGNMDVEEPGAGTGAELTLKSGKVKASRFTGVFKAGKKWKAQLQVCFSVSVSVSVSYTH